jgi:hypothetical protein
MAATQELFSSYVLLGEASVAVLAIQFVVLVGFDNFILEGDAILVILTINSPFISSSWFFVILSQILVLFYPHFKARML